MFLFPSRQPVRDTRKEAFKRSRERRKGEGSCQDESIKS